MSDESRTRERSGELAQFGASQVFESLGSDTPHGCLFAIVAYPVLWLIGTLLIWAKGKSGNDIKSADETEQPKPDSN